MRKQNIKGQKFIGFLYGRRIFVETTGENVDSITKSNIDSIVESFENMVNTKSYIKKLSWWRRLLNKF